ncbi:MAG: DNA-binding protein [Clostridiales bacterium]|nr:DNA-binding protein [Clostridiales bacterium]
MFQKNMNISFLLDFYGDVLDEKPRMLLDLYYNEDLSLAEIAESEGMTRQGVRHVVKKAEQQLLFLENKLGLANHFVKIRNVSDGIIASLSDACEMLSRGADTDEIQALLAAQIAEVRALAQIGE